MGVEAIEATFPFDAKLDLVEEASPPAAKAPPGGSFYVLDHGVNDSFLAVNRLLKEGADVSWATRSISAGGKQYPPGAVIVTGSGLAGKMRSLAEELGLQIQAGSGSPPRDALRLKPLKLGLYQPWTANTDEGWTRWVFDTWEVPYATIHDAEIRNGGLERNHDVILIPSMSPQSIVQGHEEGTVPSQYAGGIGNRGLSNLIQFVQSGGTLITFDAASNLVIDYFKVPVVNAVQNVKPEEFFGPGTLLKVYVDNKHPIAYGMDENAILMFSRSPVFELAQSDQKKETSVPKATKVASYPDVSPLMSGWILGEEKLFGKSALVEVDYGKGKIILFGFRPQNRAQTHGTFKLLFNALYYGPATTSMR